MKVQVTPIMLLIHFVLLTSGCGLDITVTDLKISNASSPSFDFSSPESFDFDDRFIEFNQNAVGLRTVDSMLTSDNFSDGNHIGTTVNNGQLSLATQVNPQRLHVNELLPALSSDLVGYWPMDNDNWQDLSGQNNHGTEVFGDAEFTSEAIIGTHSGLFDNDGVSVGDASLLRVSTGNAFSISAWFNTNNIDTNYRRIFDNTEDAGSGRQGVTCWVRNFGGSDNRIGCERFQAGSGGGAIYGFNVETNRSYHLVFLGDGTNVFLYVDGVQVATNTQMSDEPNGFYTLGSASNGSLTTTFNGRIDSVAFIRQLLVALMSKHFLKDNRAIPLNIALTGHLILMRLLATGNSTGIGSIHQAMRTMERLRELQSS